MLALTALCWWAFFHGLHIPGPVDKTEALQMEIARRMAVDGDWITPRWNGAPYFDKPVWPYWMGALGFHLIGLQPWAARLPAALTASAGVAMASGALLALAPIEETAGRRWGRALLGGAILALSPAWMAWGRSAVHDIYLAASISLSLFGFLLGFSRGGRAWPGRIGYGAIPVGMGLGILAKGPLGLVLPLATILAFLAVRRRLDLIRRHIPICLLMLLGIVLISLTWYGPVTAVNGRAFLDHFFGFSNLDRLHSVVDDHAGPWFYYLPVVGLLFFPWSLFLPVGLLHTLALERTRRGDRPAGGDGLFDLNLLCAIGFLITLLLFSLATTKLPGYILPLIPGSAVLVTLTLVPPCRAPLPAKGLGATAWLNLVMITLAAVLTAAAPRWLNLNPLFPELNRSVVALVQSLAAPLFTVAVLVVVARLWPTLRPRPGQVLPPILLPVIAADLALNALVAGTAFSRGSMAFRTHLQDPVAAMSRKAAALAGPEENIHVVGAPHYSVVFHGGRPVHFSPPFKVVKGGADLLDTGSAGSVIVLGHQRGLKSLKASGHPYVSLARQGDLEIIRMMSRPAGSGP